jgi:predicted hydrocarbon binding protein
MRVKAQGLLNAAKYFEEQYGAETLGEIIRACSPAVRETYTSSIAINWHPVEELTELIEVAAEKLGRRPTAVAHDVGAAGARANMKGTLLRIAFYWGKPEYLMKRAAGLWRQFNDEGSMSVLHMDTKGVLVEVSGIAKPSSTFCGIINGWCHETAIALGIREASAHHIECRARGDARCIFEVRGVIDETQLKTSAR